MKESSPHTTSNKKKGNPVKPQNIIGLAALTTAGITLYNTNRWHWMHPILATIAAATIITDRKTKGKEA